MNFINFIISFFYAHPFEKEIKKFLRQLKKNSYADVVEKQLTSLMQKDLAILNIYLEWKSRGYKYLKKRHRRKLYANLIALKADFLKQVENDTTKFNPIIMEELKQNNLSFPVYKEKEINYLWQIMRYLEPGKRFIYQESTSFGHLINDPTKEKLIGDCNQITTLYAYFYALKYPITDLKIKILPEHVCLHFENLDIEATSGHFANYQKDNQVLSITELISTNLLDISDSRETQTEISPKIVLKISQLAYKISSNKELVAKNLEIAYKNLAITSMRENNFESAIFFIKQTSDRNLLLKTYYNAAIYYLNNKNFKKAHYYAALHGDIDLKSNVSLSEANDYYQKDNTKEAIKIYKKLGKHEMVRACLQKDFFKFYQQVKDIQTLDQAKTKKSTYLKLRDLAQQLQDSEKTQWVESMLGKI
ncbi:MAG: hypothetical protein UR28_C0002G0060 [Candidatus Peregrinibacteria bacterium GW2011_GWF2_33_10]|nr:MAG: hypothetical protein UR28_C0002G0060 [Candidatus Peregrinibacteria bacterium GW2011_GWF2_33_10]OGJ45636.1 MAG: hypothetical protein A2263_00870 [Candidatus Peregrinibacteria bacterium RIFOXYA2_FULL_33_21]OGJ46567.1 MAG: hypothetical protein A2272_06435 [Candidatus Peregrinibacteria bacterium RIFOXYA12_FULL_33_12]OGJ51228.1 MAG: hypothetical protein A2307_01255 [Candidatus Peregrinibacteria bacterium RIFOXYB2_FULL_33_20]